jgi:hypothetical protein
MFDNRDEMWPPCTSSGAVDVWLSKDFCNLTYLQILMGAEVKGRRSINARRYPDFQL